MRSLSLLTTMLAMFAAAPSAHAGLFEYAADDGSGNINIGPAFSAEMLWGNYFTAESGFNTITTIRVSFGSIAPDRPLDLLLFDDPDDDGDPGNAVLVAQSAALTVAAGPNVFIDYAIDPTSVSSGFFVAAKMLVTSSDRPGRLDPQSITGQSWLYFADQIDVGNLGGSPYVLNMDNAPFPGTWMMRAMAVPVPGTGAAGLAILAHFGLGHRRRTRITAP